MKNKFRFGIWSLRLGLAAVYLYSGYALMFDSINWVGYMPVWFQNLLPVAPDIYIKFQGFVEFLFALSFLTGFQMKWVGLLSSFEMFGILMFTGINDVTFRDFGIFGAALSLFFLSDTIGE